MSEAYVETSQTACRQVGHRVGMDWFELPECEGCQAQRDWEYIYRSRDMIDGIQKGETQ